MRSSTAYSTRRQWKANDHVPDGFEQIPVRFEPITDRPLIEAYKRLFAVLFSIGLTIVLFMVNSEAPTPLMSRFAQWARSWRSAR